jgi:translation initiation factor 1
MRQSAGIARRPGGGVARHDAPPTAEFRSLTQMPKRRGDTRVVWSSDDGDLRKARDPGLKARRAAGGRVKVRRETSGRRGKAVTTVADVPLDDDGLRELAGRLKKRCGVGGSVKDGVIELQGDHRDVVLEVLTADGYDALLAGG